MGDRYKNPLSETNYSRQEYETSRAIFKSDKVANEYLAIKKFREGTFRIRELTLNCEDLNINNKSMETFETGRESIGTPESNNVGELQINPETVLYPMGEYKSDSKGENNDGNGNNIMHIEQPVKRKAGRPKGSKTRKRNVEPYQAVKETQIDEQVKCDDLVMPAILSQGEWNWRNTKLCNDIQASKYTTPITPPVKKAFRRTQTDSNNAVTSESKDTIPNKTPPIALSLYNIYKTKFFTKFKCREKRIDQIQCQLVFNHINVMPEFKRTIKLFNTEIGAPIPEKGDYAIYKDMFLMSIQNTGFFDPKIQHTFIGILKEDYQIIVDKYIIYILPLEQYYFGKANIEIFSLRKKLVKENNNQIEKGLCADNFILRLSNGSLAEKLEIIRELKTERISRETIDEIILIYFELIYLKTKPKKRKDIVNTSIPCEDLNDKKIELFADLCLNYIVDFVYCFDFCDTNVLKEIQAVSENTKTKTDWNTCLSYDQIQKIIRIIPNVVINNNDTNIGLGFSIFTPFKQYVKLVSCFHFLIDFDVFMYKKILKNTDAQNIEGVFTIISKYNISKNTRRKIFKRFDSAIVDALLKYNFVLRSVGTLQQLQFLEDMVLNVYCFKKYRGVLEELHLNILKFNIEKKYKGINKISYKKLLSIFTILSANGIYKMDVNIELLWTASQICGYKEPVKEILKFISENKNS